MSDLQTCHYCGEDFEVTTDLEDVLAEMSRELRHTRRVVAANAGVSAREGDR